MEPGNVHEPARLIQNTCMLDYIKKSNKEGILFTIDIEKTFDSVVDNFLFVVLKKCFKQTFIAWIKAILKKQRHVL